MRYASPIVQKRKKLQVLQILIHEDVSCAHRINLRGRQ